MKRDPNLFEAFKDVSTKENPAPAPVQPTVPKQASSGPGIQPRLLAIFGACLILVFTVGYLMGGGRGEVAAQEDSNGKPDSSEVAGTWQPAGPVRLEGVEVADPEAKIAVSDPSGLYNPENRYTVLAITYTDVPSLQERAKSIAEFLRSQGLPAFEPVARSGNLEILVGAEQTKGALQELTAKLRGTRGPTGRSFDFQSALVVLIDDHLDRD